MVAWFRAFASTPLGRRFLLFMLFLLLLLALAEAALNLTRALFDTTFRFLGLGAFIFTPMALAAAWKAHKGAQSLRRRWNRWLGAAVLTCALLAVLAYAPAEGTVFAPAPWGGYLGLAVRGPDPLLGLVRILMVVFIGSLLVTPRFTWRWTRLFLARLRTELVALAQLIGDALGGLARSIWRGIRSGVARPSAQTVGAAATTVASPSASAGPAAPPAPADGGQAPATAPAPSSPASPEPTPFQVTSGLKTVQTKTMVAPLPGLGRWRTPALDILERSNEAQASQEEQQRQAHLIEEALASYGIEATVVQINPGPTVTQYGVEPGWLRKFKQVQEKDKDGRPKLDRHGQPVVRQEEVSRTRVKVDSILALDKDLALALAAPSIRLEAPVPGKPIVGIEVPNPTMSIVALRAIIESAPFQRLKQKSRLPIVLGKGAGGEPVVADLTHMPHCLVAGATGSGKSVFIHAVVTCLLMHATPEEMRLLLVDPKRVEMVAYNGVPHLITPVIVDADKVVPYLKWANGEMDSRYKRLSAVGARNIEGYNRIRKDGPMPYVVIAIDELADLMMTAPVDVEHYLCRLAQLGRAVGIHLVVATQRPEVKVITGLIKANFPTRVSFGVTSFVDSRVILDEGGAEKLLGRGDMLYLPSDAPKPKRLQGPYVSEQEVEKVVGHWRTQRGSALVPELALEEDEDGGVEKDEQPSSDALLEKARAIALQHSRMSTSLLQRKLGIGYPRAARLMDQLEALGVVSAGEPGKSRDVIRGKDAPSSGEDVSESNTGTATASPDAKTQAHQS
ncbi:MAG: DNA translocase FtsK 4TM domain-containing protein [Chloroflexi bacterium]|nr:DNA translocase FtsK 4TM domain-containing protein [Chloroflexota bacterium]